MPDIQTFYELLHFGFALLSAASMFPLIRPMYLTLIDEQGTIRARKIPVLTLNCQQKYSSRIAIGQSQSKFIKSTMMRSSILKMLFQDPGSSS